jgi:hypothetical protein
VKYLITVFVTAVIVFLGATVYYKGLPNLIKPVGVSVVSTEEANLTATPAAATEEAERVSLDENAVLIAAVRKGLIAEHGQNASGMNITISQIQGDYAKGMASEQGGGGIWFAAKLNGTWTLVWDGNGIIDCNSVSPFPGFPTSMIPSCLASGSGTLITR